MKSHEIKQAVFACSVADLTIDAIVDFLGEAAKATGKDTISVKDLQVFIGEQKQEIAMSVAAILAHRTIN